MPSSRTPAWRAKWGGYNRGGWPRRALTSSSRRLGIGEENAVNVAIVALLSMDVPAFAVGISHLQAELERWDHQRHAQD
jgi:hypothetical protein